MYSLNFQNMYKVNIKAPLDTTFDELNEFNWALSSDTEHVTAIPINVTSS